MSDTLKTVATRTRPFDYIRNIKLTLWSLAWEDA